MTATNVEQASGTQAVDRAAALLTYVVEADHPVAFTEVLDACGLARSTCSRMLAALERTRLLERTVAGEYVGGPLFVLYAARHDRNQQLARLARPALELIGDETGETVHLAVGNGNRVAHIDQVDSTYLLGARDWTDVEVPAHSSALGKVLLAWGAIVLPDGELATPTERTLGSRAAVHRSLEVVRNRGFAITRDELEVGLAGIAAPVFAPDVDLHSTGDSVVAAVGISGPTARLMDRVEEVARLLLDQTQALSELLHHGSHEPAPRTPERTTA